jgi:trans-aconitate methyltransferase
LDQLKQSFNLLPDSYELYRPNYPTRLYHDVLTYADVHPSNPLLEIGCGTGKATEGFIHQGYKNIDCIEYGQNLAAFSKKKFADQPGINVFHSSFEDWTSEGKQYSLAFSGTAFHFIPFETGYPKVASILKTDGTIAFFWFVHVSSNEPVFRSIREVYTRYAPHLHETKLPTLEESIKERSYMTLESGHFHELEVQTYKWEQVYSPADYIGLLNTHSGHQVLPHAQKKALYDGIIESIFKHNGHISKQHVVVLYLARKR